MGRIDPHSFTESSEPATRHIGLALYLDFPSSTIEGSALFTLDAPHTGPFSLDTRGLTIHSVLSPETQTPIPFSLSAAHPFSGSQLSLTLSNHTSFLISYTTSPSSSALQWLLPPQTLAKSHPFVYTQCQAIHARSVFPCQDTPAVRIRYSALLNIPSHLSAVMAARHLHRRPPREGDLPATATAPASWCSPGRVVEEFLMDQPVPPYLFAFAVGGLGNREVGPRTRLYAEDVPALLDSAAAEFAGTEEMIREGERLFGPYEWERFDLLVLPPSFPYGGMENPRMVFLTPTVVKGDATGAQVVAHELAHSWTGNLITNKTNEHFWLNEGFTTYAERRIVEAVQGEQRATLNIGIGWRGLNEDVERFKDNLEFTKLKNNQEGIDPDDVYSQVPYEKGFQFLWRIERQFSGIGMPREDEVADWQGQEWELYLDNLPKSIEASQLFSGVERELLSGIFELVIALDSRYKLSESKDYEVKVSFLQRAISCGCRDYYNEVEKTLKEVGRMKYLRPLYTALVKGSGKEDDKVFAKRIFSEARECYHPIAQVDETAYTMFRWARSERRHGHVLLGWERNMASCVSLRWE
ncbi:hypothetical protein Fmac_022911 [Flemingia macrophylla]|uniref:Peptidase M1 leukotriene A4 hydrolase/aminopeptidase C-terminal domain-containing protein n=1 Tax=Flemingia macrophylla TaxID=520843 RepID=A0ABD1LKK0_9FABA